MGALELFPFSCQTLFPHSFSIMVELIVDLTWSQQHILFQMIIRVIISLWLSLMASFIACFPLNEYNNILRRARWITRLIHGCILIFYSSLPIFHRVSIILDKCDIKKIQYNIRPSYLFPQIILSRRCILYCKYTNFSSQQYDNLFCTFEWIKEKVS